MHGWARYRDYVATWSMVASRTEMTTSVEVPESNIYELVRWHSFGKYFSPLLRDIEALTHDGQLLFSLNKATWNDDCPSRGIYRFFQTSSWTVKVNKNTSSTLAGLKPSNKNASKERSQTTKQGIISLTIKPSVNLVHYARGSNSNNLLRPSAFWTVTLNLPYYFVAFNYLPKYDVSPIQLKICQ